MAKATFRPVKFALECLSGWNIYVELADYDRNLWAVRSYGLVLNRRGEWEHEPQPSSRTSAFLKRTRFSLAEAKRRAGEAWEKIYARKKA